MIVPISLPCRTMEMMPCYIFAEYWIRQLGLPNETDDERTLLLKQIESIEYIHGRYESKIPSTREEVINSYSEIVRYAACYLNCSENKPLDIWAKFGNLSFAFKSNFKPGMILVELCLCAPYSNAEVERFFNHMKYIKSSWRTSLINSKSTRWQLGRV